MRIALILFLLSMHTASIAEVFRCGEPKGVVMWSHQKHKADPDSFPGVKPVVIVEGDEMRIVWGDSKIAGGAEKVWKTIVFHRSAESVSGVALDASSTDSAAMLYTVDLKRGYLYLSSHKYSQELNLSWVSTFVSKCTQ